MSSLPLEIGCPGCGRTLRIAAEHAGRQIRCPNCQQISVAPGALGQANLSSADDSADSSAERPAWYVQTPEGPIYGPITWNSLREWATEGRIDRACRVGESAQGPWRGAAELLPSLPLTTSSLSPNSNGPAALAGAEMPAGNRPANTMPMTGMTASPAGGWVAPHRGGLIFILGLLGLIVGCPVFSFLAWVMGARDLGEIRARRMDSQGAGLTMGGMILGIVVSAMWLVLLCGIMTVLLVAAAFR